MLYFLLSLAWRGSKHCWSLCKKSSRDFDGQKTPEDSVTTEVCLLQGKEIIPVAGGARWKALILRDSTGHHTSQTIDRFPTFTRTCIHIFLARDLNFGIDLNAGPKVHRRFFSLPSFWNRRFLVLIPLQIIIHGFVFHRDVIYPVRPTMDGRCT